MTWFAPGLVLNVNPEAGSYDPEVVELVRAGFAERADVRVVETTSPDELDDAVAGLGERVLVVVGGDGSVHAAVAALHRAGRLGDAVLAVVPQGTGNDLAGGLGIPVGPEAVDHLGGLEARALDVIETEDAVVVNAAHAGLGAIAAERGSDLKGLLGKAAYPAGALAAAGAGPWRVRVVVDGTVLVEDGAVVLVAIANGHRVGGGTELAPGAEPDDGLADVLVATATGGLDRVALGAAIVRGTHIDLDQVRRIRGRHVEISGDALPWNLDGELPGERAERSFRVLPGALRLVC